MIHLFQKGSDETKPTFLLLHGTGGTEHDLLPIANEIDSTAHILSVRGNILENGMPRFFKRLAEGIFDQEDLAFRTKELHDFLDEAAKKYGFDRKNILAMGYSNGANIAANLLFHYPDSLSGALLFHPLIPLRGKELPDLTTTPVFIGAGKHDPLCPPEETADLSTLLTETGADVTLHWEQTGHQLTIKEVEAAREWYRQIRF